MLSRLEEKSSLTEARLLFVRFGLLPETTWRGKYTNQIRTKECRASETAAADANVDSLRHTRNCLTLRNWNRMHRECIGIVKCSLRIRIVIEKPPAIAQIRKTRAHVPKTGTVGEILICPPIHCQHLRHCCTGYR